jgi:catalase
VKADCSFLTASSVLFDAVFVPGGDRSVSALSAEKDADEFLSEDKHCKAIAGSGAGVGLLATALAGDFTESNEAGEGVAVDKGIVTSRAGFDQRRGESFCRSDCLAPPLGA